MLSDLWKLVQADIPAALLNPTQRSAIERFCSRLPIRGHLGLELHLLDPDRPADLSQVFSASSAEGLLTAPTGAEAPLAEAATRKFLRLFFASPTHEAAVRLVWLEWDADSFDLEAPKPSVFLERSKQADDRDWQAALAAMHDDPEARPPLPEPLQSHFEDRGIRIGIVGAMLARTPAPGRIYLDAGCLADAVNVLRGLGVPVIDDEYLAQLATLEALGIRLRPSIDVVEGTIGDRLGIDVAWPGQDDLRLPSILADWLIDHAGLDPNPVRALGELPKVWTPVDGSWPDEFVLDSLRQPEDHFSQVTGYLHHVKLVFRGPQLKGIKAYLGFAHQYVKPTVSGTPRDAFDNPG